MRPAPIANIVHSCGTLVWMFWPLVPSLVSGSVALFFAGLPLTVMLVWLGSDVVSIWWDKKPTKAK